MPTMQLHAARVETALLFACFSAALLRPSHATACARLTCNGSCNIRDQHQRAALPGKASLVCGMLRQGCLWTSAAQQLAPLSLRAGAHFAPQGALLRRWACRYLLAAMLKAGSWRVYCLLEGWRPCWTSRGPFRGAGSPHQQP
jgi:hypothetical protein